MLKLHKIILTTALGLLTTCPMEVSASPMEQIQNKPANEYEILMEKIREDFKREPDMKAVREALKLYNSKTGAFSDIDYRRDDRTFWPPLNHLTRLTEFAYAYTTPGNSYYGKKSLFNRIVKALEYWHEVDPKCNNWWYNQIAEPQQTGILFIQMRKGKEQIPAELEKRILDRILKDGGKPENWTGANRTDIALHWIYRSCLSQNEKDLRHAIESAFSPIYYTTEEGFQHDNSYFQHGVQLYIGGYGDEILKGITQIASYTIGTQYALSQDKIDLISKFMRETYYRTFRGKYMLFDVLGRGVTRIDNLDKSAMVLYAQRMIQLDPAHQEEFKQIVARLNEEKPANYAVKPAHTHYYRADYTLHNRPEYTFDVRMNSYRTGRCEYGNGENLLTYFLSDGCTNITVDGDEYFNILPIWDWKRIPGITCPQVDEIPMTESDWQQRGEAIFAGGVSDSLYGASCYAYYDTYKDVSTGARKSWFFFDNEVVCLGDVTSTSTFDVNTTINQCRLKGGEIQANDGQKTFTIGQGQHKFNQLNWVLHNKVGYVFPQPTTTGRNNKNAEIWLNNQEQSGSWRTINRSMPDKIAREDVFSLGFNYGKEPRHAAYSYIVVPALKTANDMENYLKRNAVEIVSNTSQIQSVYQNELKIWQVIFFEAGQLQFKDMSVSANKRCALMIKQKANGKYEIHVADPAQRKSSIGIHVNLPGLGKKNFSATFYNTGIHAGVSKVYIL